MSTTGEERSRRGIGTRFITTLKYGLYGVLKIPDLAATIVLLAIVLVGIALLVMLAVASAATVLATICITLIAITAVAIVCIVAAIVPVFIGIVFDQASNSVLGKPGVLDRLRG
jgi:hypothetical protein